MCHRTCVLVFLGIGGWLALTPATAEAQGSRIISRAAVNQYLNGGYGYAGGYGYPRYYGGYTTAYGGYNGGLGSSSNYYGNGYPLYGYNNGGYGYGYGGGYPAYGYGGAFGNAMLYGRGGGF